MNMFNAVNEVRKSTIMSKTRNEWVFKSNGTVFCTVSKSDSKYFVHSINRNSTLPVVTHFMKAIALVAKQYLAIVNDPSNKQFSKVDGVQFYKSNGIIAVLGLDGIVYTKSYTDKSNFIPVKDLNFHTHIRQCYGTIIPSNVTPDSIADRLVDLYCNL